MKKFMLLAAACMLWSSLGLAQTVPEPGRILDDLVSNAEKEIVPAAEAMPEDKYSFVPTGGEFNGVRAFAEQVKHLAAANYQLAARILGEDPPHHERNESAPDSLKGKQQVLDYLKGSFAYLHRAVATIDARNLVDPIPGTKGMWQRARLGLAVDAIAHSWDHYGQMVEYLRMNGIIPPQVVKRSIHKEDL